MPHCLIEAFLRVFKVPLPAIDVSQVEKRGCIVGPLRERFLKIANCLIGMARLRGDHAEVVPRFRIVGLQPQSLFEILTCLCEVVLPEPESAEIVVGIRVVGLGSNDLVETTPQPAPR